MRRLRGCCKISKFSNWDTKENLLIRLFSSVSLTSIGVTGFFSPITEKPWRKNLDSLKTWMKTDAFLPRFTTSCCGKLLEKGGKLDFEVIMVLKSSKSLLLFSLLVVTTIRVNWAHLLVHSCMDRIER